MGNKGKTTTSNQSSSTGPIGSTLSGYQSLLGRSEDVSNAPYSAYTGELTAPLSATQQQGITATKNAVGVETPYYNTAADYYTTAGTPTYSTVDKYLNPYTKDVVDATMADVRQQDKIAQSDLLGNAAAQGALGTSRSGIAQAQLAKNQGINNDLLISGLYNTGYNTALGAAEKGSTQALNTGIGYQNLGTAASNTGLASAKALMDAGYTEQTTQNAADVANYDQWLQKQQYPFETAGWLSKIYSGIGPYTGTTTSSTSSTTSPGPSYLSQGIGLGTALLGLLARGGRVGFASGGAPYSVSSRIVPDLDLPAAHPYSSSLPNAPKADVSSDSNLGTSFGKFLGTGINAVKSSGSLDPIRDVNHAGDLPPIHADGGRVGFAAGGAPISPGTASIVSNAIELAKGLKNGIASLSDAAPSAGLGQVRGYDVGGDVIGDDFSAFAPASVSLAPSVNAGVVPDLSAFASSPWETPSAAPSTPAALDVAASPPPTTSLAPAKSGLGAASAAPMVSAPAPFYRNAIGRIESSNNYQAVGPVTKTGDRSYGRYGVMGQNIAPWTAAVLGKPMTPEEFLTSPAAQDAVFDHQFGTYVDKYGPGGASRAWFAGEGGMNNPNARDVLGTSVADYQQKFLGSVGNGVMPGIGQAGGAGSGAPVSLAAPSASQPGATPHSGLFGLVPDNLRAPLIAAGLGMLASDSPFAGVAIGQGGLKGLNTYLAQEKQKKDQSISQQRVDLEAKRLANEAEQFQKNYNLNQLRTTLPYTQMTAAEKATLASNKARQTFEQSKPFKVGSTFSGDVYLMRDPKSGQIMRYDANSNSLQPLGTGTPFHAEGVGFNTPENLSQDSGGPRAIYTAADVALPAGMEPPPPPNRDDKYLTQLKAQDPRLAETVKGIANYEISPTSLSIRGNRREQVLGMVKLYDPTYDASLFPAKQRAVTEFFAGGPTSPAGTLLAGNTAILHLAEMDKMVDKLPDVSGLAGGLSDVGASGIPFISYWANKARNAAVQGTPQGAALSQFDTARQRFTEEVTRFYSGSQGSEAERDRAIALLDSAKSPQELHAAIRADVQLMRDKVLQMQGRLMAAMGPATWKRAVTQEPQLVLLYKNARNAADEIAGDHNTLLQNQRSPRDQQALDWANAHPGDPRASAIKRRLGIQ